MKKIIYEGTDNELFFSKYMSKPFDELIKILGMEKVVSSYYDGLPQLQIYKNA